ncbi:TRAP transporter substrate-binding protein [Ureibacillus chungkukjangi]|uniref:Tripartite ATP-independent transporter DctP family solute receptor n=1 Tax=Ureibacillus chungkukjangi TaxID=1202712 RepID=A0A318TMX0_9BACL|nr:TRAP transporter substrate-binding protein [Ureibacillus chungkukjangi]MCM3387036.1 TRAP transporter substrate-binding protein [Ureibacillus chungkukjangi]PYF05227.1 tripartite ATP-independent transporter DctP family solute receptor [Ureibacillus chungkukjangi]
MFKKKMFFTLLLLMVITILAACGGNSSEGTTAVSGPASSDGEARTLRISLGLNDQHPLYKGSEKFKEIVESQTDSLKIEIYHSGQIADDRSAIEMLQFGTLDITIPSSAPFVPFVPEYGVFDLPFTLTDTEMVDSVLQGEFGKNLAAKVESQGVVQLAWWENGFRQLTNNSKPIKTLEDLKGLKIRVMENETHIASWKALGANPTPMAFTELFTAMQQKTVDGQENPYPSILLEKYPEVQKYLTETNHVYSPFLFLFSKKVWDELTPEQQEIIEDAAIEAGEYNRELTRQTAEEALEELKSQMEFTEISDEELAKFKEAVQPVIDKYKSQIGTEIVDQYLAEVEKYSKE